MGYVQGHNSALFNPFSQSMMDFKKGIYSLENKDQSDFLLSKLDITALIGQQKVSTITGHFKSQLTPHKMQNQRDSKTKEKEKTKEDSVQDEDLADRLRNIDSNLVSFDTHNLDFHGLMDSRDISSLGSTFKQSTFDFINFFIQKHKQEKIKSKTGDGQDKVPETEDTQVKSQRTFEKNVKPESAFLKSNAKVQKQRISIHESKGRV
jgi:glucan-binding YG repeat protein